MGGTAAYIGRMRFIPPTADAMDAYHLRMLLNVVVGPKKNSDLKMVDGEMCESYKRACFVRGLIEDDAEWDQCLTEATTMTAMPAQIRQLFVIILTSGFPLNPAQL